MLTRSLLLSSAGENSPNALSGLVAWGEADDIAGNDGDSVASWINKTGSGLDPAQATGSKQPTLKLNAINGRKALRFALASSQVLLFPVGAMGWLNNVAGCTIVAVVQPITVVSSNYITISQNGTTTSRFAIALSASSGYRTEARPSDANGITVTSSPAVSGQSGVPVIQTAIGDFAYTRTAANLVNGGSLGSAGIVGPGSGNSAATNSSEIGLGGRSVSSFWDGYIAAYAIWNEYHDQFSLSPVLRRWARTYGISLSA